MLLFKILVILPFINVVHSYSAIGHKFLGTCASMYLKKYEPLIMNKINTITNESFEDLSVWPDRIKRQKEYQWTKPLHYIDILECRDHYPKEIIDHYCEDKCIINAIQNFTKKRNEIDRESLSFLIHLIQDINQPLHLKGEYRGGNGYKVILNKNNRNKTTNMHNIWDTDLPKYFIKTGNFECLNEVIIENNFVLNEEQFYKMIIAVVDANIQIACKYIYKKNESFAFIKFEEYYDESIIQQLFDNYMYLIINTLKFLFNKK
jgi:hypothetical protein